MDPVLLLLLTNTQMQLAALLVEYVTGSADAPTTLARLTEVRDGINTALEAAGERPA